LRRRRAEESAAPDVPPDQTLGFELLHARAQLRSGQAERFRELAFRRQPVLRAKTLFLEEVPDNGQRIAAWHAAPIAADCPARL
jgi:hypothetical protein